MTYRPTLPEPSELRNPRWLCGCGRTAPIEGPAYPRCECGLRMRFVVVDGQQYVAPQEEEGGVNELVEERWMPYVDLAVCVDGHGQAISEPCLEREIRCRRCSQWTRVGNYCSRCGTPLGAIR